MRPTPKGSKNSKIFQSPAAAAAAAYALAKSESLDFASIGSKPKVDLSVEVNVVKEEKKSLESSIREVEAVNSVMMEKLEELNGTHVDLSKVLMVARGI